MASKVPSRLLHAYSKVVNCGVRLVYACTVTIVGSHLSGASNSYVTSASAFETLACKWSWANPISKVSNAVLRSWTLLPFMCSCIYKCEPVYKCGVNIIQFQNHQSIAYIMCIHKSTDPHTHTDTHYAVESQNCLSAHRPPQICGQLVKHIATNCVDLAGDVAASEQQALQAPSIVASCCC